MSRCYNALLVTTFQRKIDCLQLLCIKTAMLLVTHMGSGGRVVKRRTVSRGDGGSIPPTAVSKFRQFRLLHICLCLSEETLKAGGPFYMVSMPGKEKDPTQGVNV